MKKISIIFFVICFILIGISVYAAKPFPAPTDLTATTVSSSQIDLNWTDNSNDEDGFSIERSLNGVNFDEIDTVGEDVTTYNNTDLDPDTTYYYKVRAFRIKKGQITYSDYSNTDSETTLAVLPDAPTNLIGQMYVGTSTTHVLINWNDNSDNETGFSIERSINGIDFEEIDTMPANTPYYDDWDVVATSNYYYKVRAYNDFGYSDYSNTIEVLAVLPDAPAGLDGNVYYATSTPYVLIDWTDNSDNETGFSIERSINGIDFEELDTVMANITYYEDWQVMASSTYYYKVRAYNDLGYSDYTNTIQIAVD